MVSSLSAHDQRPGDRVQMSRNDGMAGIQDDGETPEEARSCTEPGHRLVNQQRQAPALQTTGTPAERWRNPMHTYTSRHGTSYRMAEDTTTANTARGTSLVCYRPHRRWRRRAHWHGPSSLHTTGHAAEPGNGPRAEQQAGHAGQELYGWSSLRFLPANCAKAKGEL